MQCYAFNDHEDVIASQYAPSHSMMVFDNEVCTKQHNFRAFSSIGRYKDVNCSFLCQTYTRILKHSVRDKAKFFVLFKEHEMNLTHMNEDHANAEMTFSRFEELRSSFWKDDKYVFVVVDKGSQINGGWYREGFDCFIKLSNDD